MSIVAMRLNKTTLKQLGYDIVDIVCFLLFFAGIMLFVRLFLVQPYSVVGESMFPTFEESDFIIVDKISPRIYGYQRDDVIVFIPPEKDIPYIKRVIGLPGDTIKLQSGHVIRCHTDTGSEVCQQLDEPYLDDSVQTIPGLNGKSEFFVGSGGLFVMGDNRPGSSDSRTCFGVGCVGTSSYIVPYDHIIGKVFMRIYPRFQRSSF